MASRAEGATDDRTLALVLPGGGMLGSWQAGFLAELHRSGLGHVFDLTVGCSAGAINGMYFTAGQAEDCAYAYTDVLSGPRFINPARMWRIMDIDYLIDGVVSDRVALDLQALRTTPKPAYAIVTELTSGTPDMFDQRHPQLLEVLRATAAAPVVYGRAPQVGEHRYMDGGLSAPFPVKEAFSLGATDMLVVVPHPHGRRWQLQRGLVDAGLAAWCRWRSPEFGVRAYRRAPGLFDSGMQLCEAPPGPELYAAFPTDPAALCGFGERDRASIGRTARAGAADCRRLLDEMNTAL